MALADYRLTPVTARELEPAQRAVWEEMVSGQRGGKSVRAEGFLVGPFDALVRSPAVALSASRLGEVLRFQTGLTPRERELAIVTVAAHWRAGFAWLRHEAYARESGLAADVVADIAAHREPSFETDGDRVIYDLVSGLVREGGIGGDRYAAALDLLGERRLVELVALSGYYCFSCVVLNAFRVPLPDGAGVPWSGEEAPTRG